MDFSHKNNRTTPNVNYYISNDYFSNSTPTNFNQQKIIILVSKKHITQRTDRSRQ